MNNQRRKSIDAIVAILQQAQANLENIQEEEQECFDNLPESFQDGEKGETAQEAIDSLQNAYDSIEEAIEYAETAKG